MPDWRFNVDDRRMDMLQQVAEAMHVMEYFVQ